MARRFRSSIWDTVLSHRCFILLPNPAPGPEVLQLAKIILVDGEHVADLDGLDPAALGMSPDGLTGFTEMEGSLRYRDVIVNLHDGYCTTGVTRSQGLLGGLGSAAALPLRGRGSRHLSSALSVSRAAASRSAMESRSPTSALRNMCHASWRSCSRLASFMGMIIPSVVKSEIKSVDDKFVCRYIVSCITTVA